MKKFARSSSVVSAVSMPVVYGVRFAFVSEGGKRVFVQFVMFIMRVLFVRTVLFVMVVVFTNIVLFVRIVVLMLFVQFAPFARYRVHGTTFKEVAFVSDRT